MALSDGRLMHLLRRLASNFARSNLHIWDRSTVRPTRQLELLLDERQHVLVRARSLWARRLGTSDQPFIFLMCKCRNLISLSILDGSQSNSGLKYMRVSSFRICCQNAVKPPFACVTACRRSSIPSMSRLMNSIGISLQQSCTCIQSWSKFVALTGS